MNDKPKVNAGLTNPSPKKGDGGPDGLTNPSPKKGDGGPDGRPKFFSGVDGSYASTPSGIIPFGGAQSHKRISDTETMLPYVSHIPPLFDTEDSRPNSIMSDLWAWFKNNEGDNIRRDWWSDLAFSSSGDGYKCVRLLLQAADSGQSEARFFLGWVYFDGHLVDRSLELAIHYWRLAAEQNHAYAQYMLGLAYENGHGVKKNRALAKKYLELSAKQRFGLAREKLAEMKAKTRP